MNKELCFCIEDSKLYLEQVLVDYNDIPIFFICKDGTSYYVVLCADVEELRYIVVKVSDVDLYSLLHGCISMREIFTLQETFWEIISGEEIETDIISYKATEQIDSSVLPKQGAYFEILTDEIDLYVNKFDDEFFSNERFQTVQQKPNFNEKDLTEFCSFEFKVKEFMELCDYKVLQIKWKGLQSEITINRENMQSALKLNRLVFDKIEFNRLGFQNENELVLGIESNISKRQDAEVYRITLILKGDKPGECSFELSLTGFFTIEDSEDVSEELKKDLVSKNAIAIMMPYLRSEVSLLTAQPEVECVVLPPLNINKMLEESKRRRSKGKDKNFA